ncbi:unnamed protein product [Paramecium sonneborni]|uniref:Uncharacterized protein n=1 Tax=Paramecium sonneborni TaxID=65129 RepID=A0A8S1NZ50_9CILI|nr:unnamed protein product [Paramecium sonneborni]
MLLKSDSIEDRRSQIELQKPSSIVENSITLSLRRRPHQRVNTNKQDGEDSYGSYNLDHHERSLQKIDSTPRESPLQNKQIQKASIFTKAAQKRQQQGQSHIPEVQTLENLQRKQQDLQDSQQNLEELRNVIAKHIFINKWYQGPSYERANDNFFIRDDKIIIIEDDSSVDNQEGLKKPEEILNKLVQSHINPTNYVLQKNETLDKVKEEGDRQQKLKKETETKKLIKNSDVRMTIYPAYDNFFKKQQ